MRGRDGGRWAAVAMAATLAVTSCGPDDKQGASTPAASDTAVAGGSWRAIGEAPGDASGAPVWTGDALVVWGGQNPGGWQTTSNGAAYQPASDRWRELAASPLTDRGSHSGVWTGTEVLYWGGLRQSKPLADGAAYNPSTNRWRALPRAPLSARFGHEAVWTGQEMVVWGGAVQCCPIDSILHDVGAAAYNPTTDTWRRLADVPQPWSGDDGAAVTGASDGRLWVWRHGRLGALDLRTDRWADLGSPPPAEPGGDMCGVTGGPISVGSFTAERLVVWTGGCAAKHGAAYDLRAGTWAPLPPGPADSLWEVVQTPALVGVTQEQEPELVRLDGEQWRPVDVPRRRFGVNPAVLWTGTDVVVWGGYRENTTARTGVLFRPLY